MFSVLRKAGLLWVHGDKLGTFLHLRFGDMLTPVKASDSEVNPGGSCSVRTIVLTCLIVAKIECVLWGRNYLKIWWHLQHTLCLMAFPLFFNL